MPITISLPNSQGKPYSLFFTDNSLDTLHFNVEKIGNKVKNGPVEDCYKVCQRREVIN